MSAMKRILELMVEKKAPDIYLSAHSSAQIKINGTTAAFNNQILGATTPLNLLSEIVTSAQIEELKETGELNTSIQLPDLGNFRISGMRQRGSYAVVVRYIPLDVPPFDTLYLPAQLTHLVMAKIGLVLMVGATGSGKSTTLASLLEYRNEPVSYTHLRAHETM
jgi:twitching motility protein PilU